MFKYTLPLIISAFCFIAPAHSDAQKKKPASTKKAPAKKISAQPVQAKQANVTVNALVLNGTTKNLPDNSKIALINTNSGKTYNATVLNDSFAINTKLDLATVYVIQITAPNNEFQPVSLHTFLDNEVVTVEIENTNMTIKEGVTPLSFNNMVTIFGNQFNLLNKVQEDRKNSLLNQDSLTNLWNKTIDEIAGKALPFLNENGHTAVAPFFLNTIWPLTSNRVEEFGTWLAAVSDKQMASDYGVYLKNLYDVEKQFGYGQVVPDFSQKDPAGNSISLKSFRRKYVLIHFCASWCGPCRVENPNIVAAYNKYKHKNFEILGVSLDRDRTKWLDGVSADNLTWPQVSDLGFWNNAVAKQYRITSIPQNILIDPQGKIVGKNLRGGLLENFLEKTL